VKKNLGGFTRIRFREKIQVVLLSKGASEKMKNDIVYLSTNHAKQKITS